jgi:hypothetical protein
MSRTYKDIIIVLLLCIVFTGCYESSDQTIVYHTYSSGNLECHMTPG